MMIRLYDQWQYGGAVGAPDTFFSESWKRLDKQRKYATVDHKEISH